MNSGISGDIVYFEWDQDLLQKVEKALGDLKSKSRKVMKDAVNGTAKQAKKDLARKAQQTYTVKQGGFTKAMKTKNATEATLTATIKATGQKIDLKQMKVSPATYATGVNKPSFYRAKNLKSGGLKALDKNPKAFLSKIGGVQVVERVGESRLPIRKMVALAVPQMLGSKAHVYGVLEPQIHEKLMANVDRQIKRVLYQG